ncbi:MAG: hypothetical protein LBM93_08010, partial [Oscillospiraceae bacterium]|nr:hypothetical protein [Oscillospiraceae bacterium]
LLSNFSRFLDFDYSSDLKNEYYDNDNLLALLYNAYENVMAYKIQQGIQHETKYHQPKFSELFTQKAKPETQMEKALRDAGIILTPSETTTKITDEGLTEFSQKFCEATSFITKYSISCPYMLLIRYALGDRHITEEISKILDVIRRLPFINVIAPNLSDNGWEHYISFRTPLEAESFLKSINIFDLESETNIITDLIKTAEFSKAEEERAICELLKKFGPNNRNNKSVNYGNTLLRIAEVLEKKRNYGLCVIAPEIVCQEIVYTREYYSDKRNCNSDGTDIESAIIALKRAAKLASDTISEIEKCDDDKSNRRIKMSLIVEEVTCKINISKIDEKTNINYREIRERLKPCFSESPTDTYPITCLMNSFNLMIAGSLVKDDEKLKYTKEIIGFIESFDNKFYDDKNEFVYNSSKTYLYKKTTDLIGGNKYKEFFEDRLEKQDPTCIYLEAFLMCKNNEVDFNETANDLLISKANEALNYLNKFENIINNDENCLYLKLKLYWYINVRHPMFEKETIDINGEKTLRRKERNTAILSDDKWKMILAICKTALGLIGVGDGITLNHKNDFLYFAALASAHIGDLKASIKYLKDTKLNRATFSKKRWYLIADSKGNPKEFIGKLVENNPANGNMKISIPELPNEKIFYHNQNAALKIGYAINRIVLALGYDSFGAYKNDYNGGANNG